MRNCRDCKNRRRSEKICLFLPRHDMHIFRWSAMFIFCCSFQTPSSRLQSSGRCRGSWLQIVTSTTAAFLYTLVLQWNSLTTTSAEIVVIQLSGLRKGKDSAFSLKLFPLTTHNWRPKSTIMLMSTFMRGLQMCFEGPSKQWILDSFLMPVKHRWRPRSFAGLAC